MCPTLSNVGPSTYQAAAIGIPDHQQQPHHKECSSSSRSTSCCSGCRTTQTCIPSGVDPRDVVGQDTHRGIKVTMLLFNTRALETVCTMSIGITVTYPAAITLAGCCLCLCTWNGRFRSSAIGNSSTTAHQCCSLPIMSPPCAAATVQAFGGEPMWCQH